MSLSATWCVECGEQHMGVQSCCGHDTLPLSRLKHGPMVPLLTPAQSTDGTVRLTYKMVPRGVSLMSKLRAVMSGEALEAIEDGLYCVLDVDDNVMMSDTPMETVTNQVLVSLVRRFRNKHGRRPNVLLAGLGIGYTVEELLPTGARRMRLAESVTVVEKNASVLEIIAPQTERPFLNIVHQDVHEYQPTEQFDIVWFDIWPKIDVANIPEMETLHEKFDVPYRTSWLYEHLLTLDRGETHARNSRL